MPFYEYVCTECGEQTEVLQRLSDPPETECPSCHQPALIKQVSAAGFRLKGGGWYETDFKSDNKRNLEGDSAAAPAANAKDGAGETKDAKSEAKVDSKSDSKPDSKPDSKSGKEAGTTKAESKPEAKPTAKSEAAAKPSAPATPKSKPSDSKTPA